MEEKRRGRPYKYDYEKLTDDLLDYIDRTDIPILAEFCYEQGILRENIYAMAERNGNLKYAIKRCIERKEVQLEKKSLSGDVDKTMAIFSLKQLGWKDKQEIEHSGGMNNTNEIKHDLNRLDKKELKQLESLLAKSEGD